MELEIVSPVRGFYFGLDAIPDLPQISALHFVRKCTYLLCHPAPQVQRPNTMPADDYTAAVSGGLKLKSVSSSSKVSKSNKKKRPKPSKTESSGDADAAKLQDTAKDDSEHVQDGQDDAAIEKGKEALEDREAILPSHAFKTEAELRHEERRRKRVCL